MSRYANWQDGEIVDEIEEQGVNLTPWEIDFVESVVKTLNGDEELSDDQRSKLIEIAEDRVP